MIVPKNIERNIPLAPLTTFRVGGNARYFLFAENISDIRLGTEFAKEKDLPVFILGRGSNLLVSDSGFKGLVIKLGKEFQKIYVKDNLITAGASISLPQIARIAVRESLSGFEWSVGIPASIGGAVRMNAGAFGSEISDNLKSATILSLDSFELKRTSNKEIDFSYRKSSLKDSDLILEADFLMKKLEPARIKGSMERFFKKRKNTQPLGERTAGSIFKNPDSGKSAAALIEACDLKGTGVGGAFVSEKHANFIVNLGSARASDILRLINKIKAMVYKNFEVELETEIIILGEF